jgi:CDP-diglyceride synthetase
MNSVIAMVAKYLLGMVKFHPDTWKSKTFFISIAGALVTSMAAILTSLQANDPNGIDYIKDLWPFILAIGGICMRDAHSKSSANIQKALDIISKVTAS